MTAAEKQKLRNQISAQRSRTNKKLEMAKFQDEITRFRAQFAQLAKILNEEINSNDKESTMQRIYKELPDTTDFEDLPNV